MKPVRSLLAVFAVVALVPIWLVRAGDQSDADPRSPSLVLVRGEGILDEDRQKVIDYYQASGFFDAKVSVVTQFSDNPGQRDLKFVISEGMQYKVRNLIIEGNLRIKTEALRKDLELHSGKPFRMAVRDADKNRMLIQYREIGCIDAQIDCEPRFTNEQGVVDLVYRIDERQPYTLGEFEIVGNDRTMDKVIRPEVVQAGLLPGETLDKNRVEILRRRLTMLGYFQNNPEQAKQIKIDSVTPRSAGPDGQGALSRESRSRSSLMILADDQGAPENPPSESEIFAKLPPMSTDKDGFHTVERTNARIVVEKIADKADPVKAYPLAGPCQLVHRHYKCTVYFDDVFRSDNTPVPFNHVDHKVHVVYIDKDFLRRAVAPRPLGDKARDSSAIVVSPPNSRDDRIHRIVREIEQLKRELQSDSQDQERVLERSIKELESLKAHDLNPQPSRR